MINRVVLVGRITRDPELRKTTSGISTVSFTLACNRKFSNSQGGQDADFINCVAWRQSADFMANYIKKGNLLGVEGRIQTRNYKDQSDRTVYVTEVVCDSVQILSQNKADGESKPSTNGQEKQASQDDFEPTVDIGSDDLPF